MVDLRLDFLAGKTKKYEQKKINFGNVQLKIEFQINIRKGVTLANNYTC